MSAASALGMRVNNSNYWLGCAGSKVKLWYFAIITDSTLTTSLAGASSYRSYVVPLKPQANLLSQALILCSPFWVALNQTP